jgi:hypothetical protein
MVQPTSVHGGFIVELVELVCAKRRRREAI